jgi:glycosyltransferase 2 family protein
LVAGVHLTVGWKAVLAPWRYISATRLAWAALLFFATYALRTIRIQYYFGANERPRYLPTLRVFALHNVLNNLMPMRSGEASFPILMRQEFGVPIKRSVAGLIYLRLLDLHVILVVAVALLTWTLGPQRRLMLACVSALPLLGFAGQKEIRRRLKSRNRVTRVLEEGLAGLPGSARQFGWVWFWTAANWAVRLLVLGLVLRAFLPLPLIDTLMGCIGGELSGVLPVSGLGGTGTYEGGVVAALVATGSTADAALAGAVNLHLFTFGTSLIGASLALLLPRGPGSQAARPASTRAFMGTPRSSSGRPLIATAHTPLPSRPRISQLLGSRRSD